MHYPWWHVPFLTAPMLIAIIATVHVLVSHYAVGGGFFLAVETHHAYRTGNREYLEYLKRHAWFFILVTVVFGAITGVGIWWIIGLVSPLATETLIHTFVFGWGMEYVFFLLEIVAAFLFYYYWGRVRPQTHVLFGGVYAFAAWVSLVLITGITAFMLNPGTWPEQGGFWRGFFNPQFVPQTLARTGASFLLASLYVFLHASFVVKDPNLRDLIGARSARPAILGSALVILGGLGWFLTLPSSSLAALTAASFLNVMMTLLFGMTGAVCVMLYLGPYRNPGWVTPGFAILLFLAGLGAFSSGEFVREAVRKPFVVYNVVLSNGVLATEVPDLRRGGYLAGGTWTRAWLRSRPGGTLEGLPEADRLEAGRVLFQYHCNSCHADTAGFSSLRHLTRGWTREMLRSLVRQPGRFHFFMPPWCGTAEEVELLTSFLESLAEPTPPGMKIEQ